jgi:hypothetical protein
MVGLLGLGMGLTWPSGAVRASAITLQQLDAAPEPAPFAASKLFTNAEVYTFLTEAKRAEAIPDPLQRCLAYPSPPGSHWLPEVIDAYCRYRGMPIVSMDALRSLIEHDKAAELDQRFAKLLQGSPNDQAELDRIYDELFDGSLETRQLIDAWTRQAPRAPLLGRPVQRVTKVRRMMLAAPSSSKIRRTAISRTWIVWCGWPMPTRERPSH